MEKSKTLSLYKFLDVDSISISTNKESRAQLLSSRMIGLDANQLLIFPYNSGNHWTLIIVDHSESCIFWMDPLKNRLDQDITNVIGMSFKIVDVKKKKLT